MWERIYYPGLALWACGLHLYMACAPNPKTRAYATPINLAFAAMDFALFVGAVWLFWIIPARHKRERRASYRSLLASSLSKSQKPD